MNLVEQQGLKFVNSYKGTKVSTIENLNSSIGIKLNSFFKDSDKLAFLSTFRGGIVEKKIMHEKNCPNKLNCSTDEGLLNTLFVIDQHIERIQEYYIPVVECKFRLY